MSKERRKEKHHADFQSICARSTDIRGREKTRSLVYIPNERMTEKKNIASSSSYIRRRSLFYLIMYIQSLITTVIFPICQCRISRSFLLQFNPFHYSCVSGNGQD